MDLGAGSYYVLGPKPSTFHTQMDCPILERYQDFVGETARLIPLIRTEDGAYRKVEPGVDRRLAISPCDSCARLDSLDWRWRGDAACLNSGEDMVSPGEEAGRLMEEYCAGCPVQVECARFALARVSGLQGIWGGIYIRPPGGTAYTKQKRASALAELRAMVMMNDYGNHAA